MAIRYVSSMGPVVKGCVRNRLCMSLSDVKGMKRTIRTKGCKYLVAQASGSMLRVTMLHLDNIRFADMSEK